ncbi:MAG: alpha/beta hydrolase [Syntrophobacteraceae bacterium]|jgi:pimeloyl-ACP methyl ester carboxylesterase
MISPTPRGADKLRLGRIRLGTGVTLHYADNGEKAGPPVVFLHGYVDSWRSFLRVIEALRPGRRAIALDLRGHGDSDKPECCYTIEDFTRDMLLFMDALGLDKANIVGHSMGSFIAQSFAARFPGRVERLILISSAPRAAGNAALLEIKPCVDALRDPIDRDFISDFQSTANPVPTDFMEMIISESLKVPARVWQSALSGLFGVDHRPILPDITAPTLIVWGNQDQIFTRRDQEALLLAIADSKLKEFDAGHALHWEKPKEAAAALQDFLG